MPSIANAVRRDGIPGKDAACIIVWLLAGRSWELMYCRLFIVGDSYAWYRRRWYSRGISHAAGMLYVSTAGDILYIIWLGKLIPAWP